MMSTDIVDLPQPGRRNNSTRRYKTGEFGTPEGTYTPTMRRTLVAREQYQAAQQSDPDTQDDAKPDVDFLDEERAEEEEQPRRRSMRYVPTKVQPILQPHSLLQQKHPLFYVGMTVFILFFGWWLSIQIFGFLVVHITDRWNYGPHHVSLLTQAFGLNNDSTSNPTRIQAYLRNSHVELLVICPSDPGKNPPKLIVGPDLSTIPGLQNDTQSAVIDLISVDINHDGKLDLQVNVGGSSFDPLFHRYTVQWLLINDSKGSFKTQSQ
jgi:hypothetical protein